MTIDEIRAQFPQYASVPDGDLLMALHRKFYADTHVKDFVSRIDGGMDAMARTAAWGDAGLRDYWRENVQKPMDGETAEDAAVRAGGQISGRATEGGRIGTAARSALQGVTYGAGDEIVAGGAALARKLTGQDGSLGDIYGVELSRERDRLNQGRENYPGTALASEVGGAVAVPLGAMSTGGNLATRAAKGAATGGLLGGAYGFMSGEGGAEGRSTNARDVGLTSAVVGGAIPVAGEVVRRVIRGGAERSAVKDFATNAPSVDTLKNQAAKLYDAARANGVTASQAQTTNLSAGINGIARAEGLVTPAGRVAETYPAIKHALNMVDDFAQGTMDPTQMQAVRRTLQNAAGSADAAERRIGAKMLEAFDGWVEPLAPQFKVANALYRRAMGGEMIDRTIELAGSKAGQFTGSGFENALRTEFRALERQIIKGQIRGLSPDQVSAISRVARGGAMENIARDIGKAAPRGVVSAGAAGGVPFAIGTTLGGPVAGAAAGLGTLAAGEIGRRTATAMQTKNAEIASALMRSGGSLPTLPALYGSAATDSVVQGLLQSNPVIASKMQGLLNQ